MAAVLWLGAALVLGSVLMRQAGRPDGQFGIDFADYHVAATRLAAGETPYASEMLAGPVDAQGQDRYRYPPAFAQLLWPLAGLPAGVAAVVWLAVQAGCVLAAAWIALRMGGARGAEPLLWAGAATTLFMPVFDTLWKGNVSGVMALQVALLLVPGALGGLALASAALLKLTPAALFPAIVAAGRRAASASLAALALAVAVSAAIAPGAWLDYARVLPNLLAGSADYATNVAPWAVAERLSGSDQIGSLVRLASLVVAVGSVVAAVALARRPGGWPAAVTFGVLASLLAPAALWYHYLAVLLPLALFAWPAASAIQRSMLAAGGALVSAGVAFLPLAVIGSGLMLAGSLGARWPRPVSSRVVVDARPAVVDATT